MNILTVPVLNVCEYCGHANQLHLKTCALCRRPVIRDTSGTHVPILRKPVPSKSVVSILGKQCKGIIHRPSGGSTSFEGTIVVEGTRFHGVQTERKNSAHIEFLPVYAVTVC